MNTKSKILVILGILIVATFTTGITYSLFFSETTLTYTNNLAKFVFNSNVIDSEYALPINELAPGNTLAFDFEVKNTSGGVVTPSIEISEVDIEYEINIETLGIAYTFTLCKYEGDVCNPVDFTESTVDGAKIYKYALTEMLHTDKAIHKYKIEITGGSDIATLEPGLIDFIDLKISSMQKVGN